MISTVTKKGKILFFIPLSLVAITLLYSWIIFIVKDYVAVFSHYLGLLLFFPTIYFLFKGKTFKKTIVLFAIYLIVATVNLLTFLPFVITSSLEISIGSFNIWAPGINGFALILLIFHYILNLGTLIEIHLDYKEAKGKL